MAQPRPSVTLVLDIDEKLDSEELRLEIDRCYAHVGTAVVRTHTAKENEPCNIMRLLVKLGTRRYLCSSDEGADELWNNVMESWLHNQLYKVGNNMAAFNRRQREVGNEELRFDWLEADLQNGTLKALLHLDSNCNIEPSCSKLLTQLRAAYNEGVLGKGVECVTMPDPASYEAQREAGLAAKSERDTLALQQRKEAEAAARAHQERIKTEAAASFLGATDLEDTPAPVETVDGAEKEAFFMPEPDFTINYHPWSIRYVDGSTRLFESTATLNEEVSA